MIKLHCTKKLLAKLPLSASGRLQGQHANHYAANDDSSPSLLSGWHGNLVTVQDYECVLLAHDSTRFAVFIPAVSQQDLAELDYRFTDCFMNTLLKCDADNAIMNNAQAALGPLVCDNDCDRSVQGTMNQMVRDMQYSRLFEDVDIAEMAGYSVGAWLSNRPCTVKGVKDCVWPIKAMHKLLLSSQQL